MCSCIDLGNNKFNKKNRLFIIIDNNENHTNTTQFFNKNVKKLQQEFIY